MAITMIGGSAFPSPPTGGGSGGGGASAEDLVAALAMTLGAHQVTLQFRDENAAPVPLARVHVVGQGYARADASGNLSISLDAGTYTVLATSGSWNVLFAPLTITVTTDGANIFTAAASSAAPPEQAAEAGKCVLYIDLLGYNGCEVGQLTIQDLPVSLGGRWLAGMQQRKPVNTSNGRITFDAVPQGAVVTVSVPAANLTRRLTVPTELTYIVSEDN